MGFFGNLFRDKSRDDEFVELCATGSLEQLKEALGSWGHVDAKGKNGATPVLKALINPDTRVLKLLLDSSKNKSELVNAPDSDKFTPLHIAAMLPVKSEVIDILVSAGANVDSRDETGGTPLMIAVNNREHTNIPVIKALIEAVKKSGSTLNSVDSKKFTALHFAASSTTEVVRLLLEAGANPNLKNSFGSTPILIAMSNPDVEVVKMFAKGGADLSITYYDGLPLVICCLAKDNNLKPGHLKALIEAGADVDARDSHGGTALILAVIKTLSPEIVGIIAEHTRNINAKDERGNSAYSLALGLENKFFAEASGVDPSRFNLANNAKNAAILEAHGATIDFVDMCRFAAPERVQKAIDSGADVNAKNSEGATPLMMSIADNPNPDVFLALLKAGVNINAVDNHGYTAFDVAVEMKNYAAADFLKSLGAKANLYR